ncbi:hypothetical protein AB0F15_11360 [Amycolatopsis sp. NPDC026612]|uniref:hypothetical protein n=1 Tax=Amycolatopsis sp. NPDC026612 TaxID=3155466 RepID=UPI0033C19E11
MRIPMAARRSSAAVVLLVLAGCQSASPGTPGAPSTTAGSPDLASLGREYSQCVRDHGVPAYPDMVVIGGHLTLPDNAEGDAGSSALRAAPAAQQACQPILARLPAEAQKENAPSAQDREKLLEFARCLRQNGIPEWPDPRADGSFPIAGTPLADETKSARMQTATQACKQFWDKGISVK